MRQQIDKIASIVRTLTPVDYPGLTAHPMVEKERDAVPTTSRHPESLWHRRLGGGDTGETLVPQEYRDSCLVDLFEKRLNALRAPGDSGPAVIRAKEAGEAARQIDDICRDVPVDKVIWQGDRPEVPREYAVGITGASALIAATGSVILELVSASDGHPSLLVDRHIVVAWQGQMLPDLPTFYQRLSDRCDGGDELPIQVCITGCSRTADIEKVLVVPAHGPRQVRVILCEAPVDWGALKKGASTHPAIDHRQN